MATLKLRYASSPPELEMPQITGEGARILSRLENGESVVVNGVEGSGKTTLALAAMKMLHNQASEVVGVTPSRARADYLNTAKTSRDLPIARPFITPTALAFQVLKQFASNRREQLPEPVLLTGSQEEERIQDLLEQVPNVKWPEYIGPEVRQTEYFRAEVRSLFAACAHWGITALDLDALGSDIRCQNGARPQLYLVITNPHLPTIVGMPPACKIAPVRCSENGEKTPLYCHRPTFQIG